MQTFWELYYKNYIQVYYFFKYNLSFAFNLM